MITELKEVISTIEKLKDEEQRKIAIMLKDEIDWDIAFEKNVHNLDNLAEEALNEYKSGNTEEKGW